MNTACSETVTVCIPTTNRPRLVRSAIMSCFKNKHRPIEILVGDSSADRRTATAVDAISVPPGISVRLLPSRSDHWDSINRLFQAATGKRSILLFDCNLLENNAIDDFLLYWGDNTVAAFGKERHIALNGIEDVERSKEQNDRHKRTFGYVGTQTSSITSAALGQFPNNGYMVLTSAAKAIEYRNIGPASYRDFAVRLAALHRDSGFLFTNQFSIRILELEDMYLNESQIWGHLYKQLSQLDVGPHEQPNVKQLLANIVAPQALLEYAEQKSPRKAISIFSSKHYRHRRFRTSGALDFVAILFHPARRLARLHRELGL